MYYFWRSEKKIILHRDYFGVHYCRLTSVVTGKRSPIMIDSSTWRRRRAIIAWYYDSYFKCYLVFDPLERCISIAVYDYSKPLDQIALQDNSDQVWLSDDWQDGSWYFYWLSWMENNQTFLTHHSTRLCIWAGRQHWCRGVICDHWSGQLWAVRSSLTVIIPPIRSLHTRQG